MPLTTLQTPGRGSGPASGSFFRLVCDHGHFSLGSKPPPETGIKGLLFVSSETLEFKTLLHALTRPMLRGPPRRCAVLARLCMGAAGAQGHAHETLSLLHVCKAALGGRRKAPWCWGSMSLLLTHLLLSPAGEMGLGSRLLGLGFLTASPSYMLK